MMPGRRMCSEACVDRENIMIEASTLPSPNAVPLHVLTDPDTTLCLLSDRNGRIMNWGGPIRTPNPLLNSWSLRKGAEAWKQEEEGEQSHRYCGSASFVQLHSHGLAGQFDS